MYTTPTSCKALTSASPVSELLPRTRFAGSDGGTSGVASGSTGGGLLHRLFSFMGVSCSVTLAAALAFAAVGFTRRLGFATTASSPSALGHVVKTQKEPWGGHSVALSTCCQDTGRVSASYAALQTVEGKGRFYSTVYAETLLFFHKATFFKASISASYSYKRLKGQPPRREQRLIKEEHNEQQQEELVVVLDFTLEILFSLGFFLNFQHVVVTIPELAATPLP